MRDFPTFVTTNRVVIHDIRRRDPHGSTYSRQSSIGCRESVARSMASSSRYSVPLSAAACNTSAGTGLPNIHWKRLEVPHCEVVLGAGTVGASRVPIPQEHSRSLRHRLPLPFQVQIIVPTSQEHSRSLRRPEDLLLCVIGQCANTTRAFPVTATAEQLLIDSARPSTSIPRTGGE
jgi:hypothetical protein